MDLAGKDATALREMFVSGQASATEILESHLERIERTDSRLGTFIRVFPEESRRQAGELDQARSRGETAGPLAAVPVGIKDIITVKGAPTTCGSRSLENFHSPFDATCVVKLKQAGGVIVGKLNMDEFAMGSSTEHSAFLTTRNPWDRDRVAGGSSGGSAAAVASGQVPLALGTDTGGSIRQPAAFTGTVGLKPTYGRVSRYGLVAFASSLDQAGPLARSVRDAALALSVLAGPDRRDMTCAEEPLSDYVKAAGTGDSLAGLRIGVPAEFFEEGLDREVSELVGRCRDLLAEQGAEIVPVSLPTMRYAIAAYYIVATAEASSNLARYDGVRYGLRDKEARTLAEMYAATRQAGFGAEVKRRIMLGTYALSAGYYDAYYLRAMKVRTRIRDDFRAAFEEADVLLGPTTPTPAFRLGEKVDDPLSMYLTDLYTVTANLAGIPALSLPCGRTTGGMPVGCQLMARHFDEATLLRTAAALESALGLETGLPDVDS